MAKVKQQERFRWMDIGRRKKPETKEKLQMVPRDSHGNVGSGEYNEKLSQNVNCHSGNEPL